MYDKYFNDRLIDKALLSDEFTEESLESYMFRIINLHNKNTNLSALKGLRKIYRLINLKNISRLKSSKDSLDVALDIFKVILGNLNNVNPSDDFLKEPQKGGDSEGSDSSDDGQGSSDNTMSDEDFNDLMDSIGKSPMTGDSNDTPTGGNGMDVENLPDNLDNGKQSKDDTKSESSVKLTDKQKDLLKSKINKQKKFLDGDIQKKSITKTDSKNLNVIEESGSELKEVGKSADGYGYNRTTQCIVVKKLTKSLFESQMFPMTYLNYWNVEKEGAVKMYYEKSVQEGIKLGTMLGKKLQVRGEDKSTIFNRQKVGKIDKRMISSLGFGNENVFQFTEIDSYKKANLHISVDVVHLWVVRNGKRQ